MTGVLADEEVMDMFRAALLLASTIIELAEMFVLRLFRGTVEFDVDTPPEMSAVVLIITLVLQR